MCHKNQNVILNRKNINKNKQTKAADKEEAINIIEIEGLLFPGFGQILAQCARSMENWFSPSSDVTRALKNGAL